MPNPTSISTIDAGGNALTVSTIDALLNVGITLDASVNEDDPSTNGDALVAVAEVRRDAPATSAGTDGDYATKNQDSKGRSYVFNSATAIDDAADVTLSTGAETVVSAADAGRRELIVTALLTNTVEIRLGKTGQVSASRGQPLQPGQSAVLATTAAVYGFCATASQKVAVLILKD
jgi:hypothetical protein